MITRCSEPRQAAEILSYLGEDYKKVPYLYVNLTRYGVSDPNIKVWIDEGEAVKTLQGVYLLYYDCLHFYTKTPGEYPEEELLDMIARLRPKVIMLPDEVGEGLKGWLALAYQVHQNYIMELPMRRLGKADPRVELAHREDLEDMAELMLRDDEYRDVYEKDALIAQLKSRYDDGFSRFFIIRRDGGIVAMYSTYGETDRLILLNGLLVHPQYRRQGLAQAVMRHAYHVLGREDVVGISFVDHNNAPSLAVHHSLGIDAIASLYKFVAKKGNHNDEGGAFSCRPPQGQTGA